MSLDLQSQAGFDTNHSTNNDTNSTAPPSATAEELTREVATAVGRAFSRFNEKRQRARRDLFGLSMSGLGGCRRRAAYQLAHIEPSDPSLAVEGEHRAAGLGTMIHEGYLPELAEELGGREEIEVTLQLDVDGMQLVIPGRSDMYWPSAKMLLDLKTVGEHKLGDVAGHGVFAEHRVQVAGYALAAERSGKPVEWIGWIYIDRGMGTSYVIVEPFTDEVRQLVIDRCNELVNYAASPHDAPRDGAGPGDRTANMICNGCPWLRACWGDDATPGMAGAQSSKVDDFGGMQEVLVGYLKARKAEAEAKDRKDFYRELIVGNDPGTYGRARWTLTKPSKTVDKNACAKIVEASGQPLPKRATEPRMIVAWVVPDQTNGSPT
jgi:hypothetical protein